MECQFVHSTRVVVEGSSDALQIHEEDETENDNEGDFDENGH